MLFLKKSYYIFSVEQLNYNFQIKFGVIKGYQTAIIKFNRSVNRDQISFTCAGWCGICGPISGQIKFQHSLEFSEFEST